MIVNIIGKTKEALKTASFRQTLFVYTGSLVNGLSLFALNVILANKLSVELFGVFSLSVFVLSTIAELSDFGLNAGLLRFAPYYIATNQPGKLGQLIKTIWRWRMWLTVVLTGGGIVLAYPMARYLFRTPETAPYLLYASFGIGGVILLGFLATFLQAKQRFFYHASLQSLKGFVRLVVMIVLVLAGVTNLFAYLSVYIFVPWVLFFASYHVLPRGFRKYEVEHEVKSKLHSQLASFSFWLTVSSLASIMAGKADQVMVSYFLGVESVAVFTVAWQLIQFFPLIYSSLTSVMTPKVSSLQNKPELIAYVKRSFAWILVGTLGLAIVIYPSQYLIHILFGGKYDASMPLYLVLAYGMLLNIVSVPFSLIINVFNRTYLTAISGMMQVLLIIACNLVLIPRYAIMGVAYTFVISILAQVAWNVSCAVYLLRKKDLIIV